MTPISWLLPVLPLRFPHEQIGRLRRNKPPRAYSSSHGMKGAGGSFNANVAAGRLLCDTYLSAKEFLRETTHRSVVRFVSLSS